MARRRSVSLCVVVGVHRVPVSQQQGRVAISGGTERSAGDPALSLTTGGYYRARRGDVPATTLSMTSPETKGTFHRRKRGAYAFLDSLVPRPPHPV